MRYFKRPEVKIPLYFFIISATWIVASDKLSLAIERNISSFQITEVQTVKGCLFIGVVTFLIHFMIKSSNKKLVQSQEEYRDLFYNTPNPMLILNLETNRFVEVNKAALDAYGYSREEFTEMNTSDIRVDAMRNKADFSPRDCNIVAHNTKDRDPIICIESRRGISFQNSPSSLLAINDVTAFEKAKSDLIEREKQLNLVLNSITDGFFILSSDLTILKANRLFRKIIAQGQIEITGQKLIDLFPRVKESGSYDRYVQAIESQTAVHFESNYKHLKKWFEVSAYPFDTGLSVFFRDITAEKEAQLQRHQNEQNLLALINNTEDLMWSVDCNFRYYIFNEPYKKNYKKTFGEDLYVGKTALNSAGGAEHVHKWKRLYERALSGEKFSIDMNFAVENECRLAIARFNPIYDSNENIIGVSCFLQDVTERKLYEKKIEKQNTQLRQIAFITSHQVRVPLANILGLVEILDSERPLSPTNCKIIEHLKTSAIELDRSIFNMVQQTTNQAND